MPSEDFARLELLCRRISTLPVLPTSALQLIRTIDSGEASALEIEKLIVNDPSLSAEFLRLASTSQLGKTATQISSIRAGIMRMGQRTVRSLATSLLVRDLVRSDTKAILESKHFARHSLAVALLAKYLFARRKMQGEFSTTWTGDEMFAAGLLADLGYVLLARMAPQIYKGIRDFAERTIRSMDDTFMAAFENPVSALAVSAADTWGLPQVFRSTLAYIHAPWDYQEEFTAICCLNYAAALAKSYGLGIETWPLEVEVPGPVAMEINIPEEEINNLKQVIYDQLEVYSDMLGTSNAA